MRLEAFKSPKRIWLKSPENDENIRQLQGICLQLIALPALICCGEEMTLLLGKATGRKGEFLTPVYLAFISSSIKHRQLLLWLFLSTGREVNGENGVMYHFLLRWGGDAAFWSAASALCRVVAFVTHFLGPFTSSDLTECRLLLVAVFFFFFKKRDVLSSGKERKKKSIHLPTLFFFVLFPPSGYHLNHTALKIFF